MTSIFKSYRPYFVILAVFVGMLMAVNHSGEFPLIDDWAYAHGVSDFLFDGVLKVSDWVAMTQVAHLFAGVGWSMIFGGATANLFKDIFSASTREMRLKNFTNCFRRPWQ